MENYFIINSALIQGSNDIGLLSMDSIMEWGTEVGGTLIKKKTAAKEV